MNGSYFKSEPKLNIIIKTNLLRVRRGGNYRGYNSGNNKRRMKSRIILLELIRLVSYY